MNYRVVIPKPVQKQLDDLPDAVYGSAGNLQIRI